MTAVHELNLDGIVGPTHNYAGLSRGNVASTAHGGEVSHPREAALQGIAKMRLLMSLGVRQAVLPPQERPNVRALRRLGFTGTDAQVVEAAAQREPRLLAACSSASAMWAANAATVVPSADTADGRVHITPANLVSTLHRSLEAPATARALRAVFPDETRFAHHDPLPATGALGDEGAANHTRLAASHAGGGLHLFVHGRRGEDGGPRRFPARQALEASRAVARLSGLPDGRVIHARQAPEAIDAGAFHNDVVCVGNEHVLLHHEQAFADGRALVARLRDAFRRVAGRDLVVVAVPREAVTLQEAVASYLFNSQLVTLPDGRMALVAPAECREVRAVAGFLEALVEDPSSPVAEVHVVDTRQSMRNGGGPACLRLRCVLTGEEAAAMAPGVVCDDALLDRLAAWVDRHYRDRLAPADLGDPSLLSEGRAALDELTGILGLGALYDFQR
ncbi:MAG: N-succinylarginine dihydrolase [Actinomycetota bacterium]